MLSGESASGTSTWPPRLRQLVELAALGEMAVGGLAVLFPSAVASLLLAAPLDANAVVIARLVGIAMATLGWTWWIAQREPPSMARVVAGGFLLYNGGVGLLFAAYAWHRPQPPLVPVIIAAVHLALAIAFVALKRRSRLLGGAP